MGRYSPTVLPYAPPSIFEGASDTLQSVIGNVRKQRQLDEENRRSDAYLGLAQGQDKRAAQDEAQRSAQAGFFTPESVAQRVGLDTPTPHMASTESRGSFGAPNLADNRMTTPGGTLAPESTASAIGQLRQTRAATVTGRAAATPSGEAPSHGEVHFQMVGDRAYVPGWSEQSFRTAEQESIYDARTRASEARKDADRERSITDIMGSMGVDHATAAGIADKSLSATDVIGARNPETRLDGQGKLWQFNQRSQAWEPAMGGGRQMTGHIPREAGEGSPLAALGRVVDDTRTAATTARRAVPTTRPGDAQEFFPGMKDKAGQPLKNPLFSQASGDRFVADSSAKADNAKGKEAVADAALNRETQALGLTPAGGGKKKPVAQRAKELKDAGKSRAEAEAILKGEGYQ